MKSSCVCPSTQQSCNKSCQSRLRDSHTAAAAAAWDGAASGNLIPRDIL